MTAQLSETALPRLTRGGMGVPSERDRYKIKRDITINEVNTLLLPTMRAHSIDMWIVLDREYHPEPLAREIGGHGGVRNAHIFIRQRRAAGEDLHLLARAPGGPGAHAVRRADPLRLPPGGVKPHLREAVQKRNPKWIGLNMSPTLPMADGLSVELKRYLDDAIGPELAAREVSAELVARDFRATRLPEETELYRPLVSRLASSSVSLAFTIGRAIAPVSYRPRRQRRPIPPWPTSPRPLNRWPAPNRA